MRILQLVNSLETGGVARQVLDLIRALEEQGVDTRVATIKSGRLSGADFSLRLDSLRGPPAALAVARLLSVVRDYRPDVVHSHAAHANLVARLARPLSPGYRQISTVHSTVESQSRLHSTAAALTLPLAHVTTGVSWAVAGTVPRSAWRTARQPVVVYDMVDTAYFDPGRAVATPPDRSPNSDVILYVGRLLRPKGVDVLLEAVALLQQWSRRRAELWVVGEGPELTQLEHVARQRGIIATFWGRQADPRPFYQSADVVVVPSRHEGLGLVVGEALSMGRRVVASGLEGLLEIGGVDTLFAHPGDPTSLATALEAALQDELAHTDAERRQARRSFVERCFGVQSRVDKWMELYAGRPVESDARP